MTGTWHLLKVFWRPPHKEDIPHYSKFFPLQITCWKRLRVLSLFESPWVFVIVCVWQRNKKCMQSERHTAGIPQLTVTSSPFCRECGRQLEMCESTFGLLCVCVFGCMYAGKPFCLCIKDHDRMYILWCRSIMSLCHWTWEKETVREPCINRGCLSGVFSSWSVFISSMKTNVLASCAGLNVTETCPGCISV